MQDEARYSKKKQDEARYCKMKIDIARSTISQEIAR